MLSKNILSMDDVVLMKETEHWTWELDQKPRVTSHASEHDIFRTDVDVVKFEESGNLINIRHRIQFRNRVSMLSVICFEGKIAF